VTVGLRRDLGVVESYAALIGILIGAGIFSVTGPAWRLTGSSVTLAYLVLAPVVLATSVPYAAYLSTPLGLQPGGEYTHISRTFGGHGAAFVGAWLKIISYLGALAFLAVTFADHVIRLSGGALRLPDHRDGVALASLVFFYGVHVLGVRWFGRLQVAMCALLGLSILVLVLPGLTAVRFENYRPLFSHGAGGFLSALPLVFFAYAGFESLAQTAGEVRDSTRRLPAVFLRGILITTAVYALMSAVAFGVLPGERLATSPTPMVDVSSRYLPGGAAWFVNLGAVMALTTSLNSTMLVPSRLALMLAGDRLAPAWLGRIAARTGTPVVGLTLTLAGAVLLLRSGQTRLALNIAVFALALLYLLHSFAFLRLPRLNPTLHRAVALPLAGGVQRAAAALSIAAMAALVGVQIVQDLAMLTRTSLDDRWTSDSLTALELTLLWGGLGAALFLVARRTRRVGRVERR
jgi:amino acid transporter